LEAQHESMRMGAVKLGGELEVGFENPREWLLE
jgi:hypothetical protein